MSKDKKKKKKDKKPGKASAAGASLKAMAQNPLVADVVAAALVATASALKDSNKARRIATEAGDELVKLSKAGAEQGSALWEMALQIGRRSLEALSSEEAPKPARAKKVAKPKAAKPKSAAVSKKNPAAAKTSRKKSAPKAR